MSNSNDNNNEITLITTLKDMTKQLEVVKTSNTSFRDSVKQRIEALNIPISKSIDYIKNLKERIAELQRDIEEDLNENTREAIKDAKVKLAKFQTEITNTRELDESLRKLTQSVTNLEDVSKDDPPTIAGGSKKRKRRKFRRTRKKRNVRKHSNKIKYR